jgi:hypothetical protein
MKSVALNSVFQVRTLELCNDGSHTFETLGHACRQSMQLQKSSIVGSRISWKAQESELYTIANGCLDCSKKNKRSVGIPHEIATESTNLPRMYIQFGYYGL